MIAIYGMGQVGEKLAEELKETDIKIAYGIDQRAASIYTDFNVVMPEEHLPEVDAVIVTAITSFDEVKENFSKRLNCPIVSIEDVMYEI